MFLPSRGYVDFTLVSRPFLSLVEAPSDFYTDIRVRYILWRARALHENLIARPLNDRMDLLALTAAERRRYVDTRWPAAIGDQKVMIHNMWRPIVGCTVSVRAMTQFA
jgi:hypothetical protein